MPRTEKSAIFHWDVSKAFQDKHTEYDKAYVVVEYETVLSEVLLPTATDDLCLLNKLLPLQRFSTIRTFPKALRTEPERSNTKPTSQYLSSQRQAGAFARFNIYLPHNRILLRRQVIRTNISGSHLPIKAQQGQYRTHTLRILRVLPVVQTERGNNLQPLNVATGYDTRNLPYTGSSRPPATSPRSAHTSESSQSQNWQPVGTPGQTRNSHEDITSRYQLRVRQQPQAARACGFGERDRRVLDPPPIVQLSLVSYDPSSPSDVSELKYAHFVVHCTLLSVSAMGRDGQDVTAVPEPNNAGKLTRKMTGTLAASPFTATDPDVPALADQNARLACFFIFSDLSCRQVGRYRLRFNIMKISGEHLIQGSTLPVLRSVESDEFEVYSAKDFPGMKASTSLIRDLKRQGALTIVKSPNCGSVLNPSPFSPPSPFSGNFSVFLFPTSLNPSIHLSPLLLAVNHLAHEGAERLEAHKTLVLEPEIAHTPRDIIMNQSPEPTAKQEEIAPKGAKSTEEEEEEEEEEEKPKGRIQNPPSLSSLIGNGHIYLGRR
ncbi:CTP synthase [Physcia stellaris]|nr:CTP synthase [Physcia stellaris]